MLTVLAEAMTYALTSHLRKGFVHSLLIGKRGCCKVTHLVKQALWCSTSSRALSVCNTYRMLSGRLLYNSFLELLSSPSKVRILRPVFPLSNSWLLWTEKCLKIFNIIPFDPFEQRSVWWANSAAWFEAIISYRRQREYMHCYLAFKKQALFSLWQGDSKFLSMIKDGVS